MSALTSFLAGSFYGKTWYSKLAEVPSRRGIILRLEMKYKDTIMHKFSHFETPVEIFNYVKKVPPEIRCFHEVVEGERSISKMRFDVDIKDLNPEQYSFLVGEAVYQLLLSIYTWNSSVTVLIYQSCCPVIRKVSYHVILPEIVGKHYQLQQLYKEICGCMPQEYSQYIDHEIYSKVKSLRLVYSTKPGESRYKVPVDLFSWKDMNIAFPWPLDGSGNRDALTTFEDSLLMCCNRTKVVLDYPEPIKYNTVDYTCNASDKEILALAIPEGDFTLREKKSSNFFILNRVKTKDSNRPQVPCSICKDVHDNDNPYIYVLADGSVKYKCRRNKDNLSKILGVVSVTVSGTSIIPSTPTVAERQTVILKPKTCLTDLVSLARNDASTYKPYT